MTEPFLPDDVGDPSGTETRPKKVSIRVSPDVRDKLIKMTEKANRQRVDDITIWQGDIIKRLVDGELIFASPEAAKTLSALAKKWKLSEMLLASQIIDVFERVGVKPVAFEDHLTRAAEDRTITNRYAFLDKKCPGLCYVVDKYVCVWGQENAPPKTKLITKAEDQTLKIEAGVAEYCEGCAVTKQITVGLEMRDKRIEELENQIDSDATAVFKAPVCKGGASLSRDGKRFEGCRKTPPNTPAGVEKFCKVYDHGNPCALYGEAIIGVGADV